MTIKTYNKCGECNNSYVYELDNCPTCKAPNWAGTSFKASLRDWVYDIETYPTAFTLWAINAVTLQERYFEISVRRDDRKELIEWLSGLKRTNSRMVGFNNIGFDYPVIHEFINTYEWCNAVTLAQKATAIITEYDPFKHTIWPSDRHVEQLDLYKINHFDNQARRTSLKVLEINMRSNNVEDLPYKPNTLLTPPQIGKLAQYNKHDVKETLKFYYLCVDQIAFRETLSEQYKRDFMNHNDTKIGKDYFIKVLEENKPGICYGADRRPRQTVRQSIQLGSVVLPYVKFDHPEFNRILNYFKTQTITETKGVFTDLHCTVDGFEYHFGVGGIHGSKRWSIDRSTDTHVVIDLDVASYYPNLAIENNLYPEHLSADFCTIYKDVYEQRRSHAKGTPENAMLKLALNGVYGDSNSKYSPFYDPAYTMAITINGQLLLCMLAEQLRVVPDLEMIQINTDGLTVRIPRYCEFLLDEVCKSWENLTRLELEKVHYSAMFIRDVNNYIAQYTDGKLKRKGAYAHNHQDRAELPWHKNHSALVIPRAAEKFLIEGSPIEETIKSCIDPFDFMIKAKAPRSNFILWGDEQQQNTLRYYVTVEGQQLIKVAPPVKGARVGQFKRKNGISDSFYHEVLKEVGDNWDERIHTKNKSKYTERRTDFESGYLTSICNDVNDFDFSNLNYQYYVDQALKLVDFSHRT